MRVGLKAVPGLCFGKAMGCGKGAVFSLSPDWGRYAVMAVWRDEAALEAGFSGKLFQSLTAESKAWRTFRLDTVSSKGLWDRLSPFAAVKEKQQESSMPLAVLTRADIHPLRLRAFWKHSYQTAAILEQQQGLLYSIGMGEWPFFRQATFSVWESTESMKAFAYKAPAHIAAMKAKQQKGIFTEELFARFTVVSDETAQADSY